MIQHQLNCDCKSWFGGTTENCVFSPCKIQEYFSLMQYSTFAYLHSLRSHPLFWVLMISLSQLLRPQTVLWVYLEKSGRENFLSFSFSPTKQLFLAARLVQVGEYSVLGYNYEQDAKNQILAYLRSHPLC